MKTSIAILVVFYRKEIPGDILSHINQDGQMSVHKDGIKEFAPGHTTPRCTIVIEPKSPITDTKRVESVITCLETLLANNQIVGYRHTA